MDMLESFVTSGQVIHLVLAVMAVELLVLARVQRVTRLGLGDVVGHLSAGFFLLLALRAALVGAHWTWVAGFLTASLPAHLYDLVRRCRTLSRG